MNPERLAKLQAQGRTASKGTPRRNAPKPRTSVAQDDRKLQAALEKLSLTNLPYVEEVNMFLEQGTVLNFRAPKGKSFFSSSNWNNSAYATCKDNKLIILSFPLIFTII